MKHYRDMSGNYLGGFDTPPIGGFVVEVMPQHADQKWDGEKWHTPKTYREAAAGLNAEYQADVAAFRDAFTGAALAGGATQAAKQQALAERFDARKAKYIAESTALRAQYGA